MLHPIFVVNLGVRSGVGAKDAFNFVSRIAVKHEYLAKVGASGAQQFQSICFGLGKSQFVAKDDACGIIFNPSQGDESAAFHWRARARRSEALRIEINGRQNVLQEYALSTPCMEKSGRAAVGIVVRVV